MNLEVSRNVLAFKFRIFFYNFQSVIKLRKRQLINTFFSHVVKVSCF